MTVAIIGGGTSVTYSPNANFNGTDSFTYTITDFDGDTDTATVTVTVTAVDDLLQATDDSATTQEDPPVPVNINVLSNDTLGDEPTTITAKTDGSDGTVAIIGGGTSVTYSPNANFNGTDSFTYTITDFDGDTDTATVTVTVTAVDDTLQATDDSATTQEDPPVPVNIDVLSNDTLGDEPTTITAKTDGSNGTVAIIGGGTSVTYSPNANFNGTDSFTYTITDFDGDTDTATVTITVNAVNDPPVATDEAYTVDEDTPLTVAAPGVLTNDTDPDGDPLTAALDSTTSNGTLTLNQRW